MNILIASDYWSPYGGNFIASFLALAKKLKAQGSEVFFLFPKRTDEERFWVQGIRDSGFEVILLESSLNQSESAKFLIDLISDLQIDILHTNFGMFTRIIRQHRDEMAGTKVLLHDHMGFPCSGILIRHIALNAVRSLVYFKKGIAVISVMRFKNQSYCFLFHRHWYVPNALATKRQVSRAETREECRKRMNISDNTKLCIVMGYHAEVKGVDIAVSAVRQARKTDSNLELAIVVQDLAMNAEDIAYIKAKTGCDITKESWIHFWPSTEDVFAYHKASDVYLSTSRTEAFSYGVLESISQDKPIVMSDIRGTKWARHYSKSLSYPVESSSKCAQCIIQSFEQPVSESNYHEIVSEYSLDSWCDKLMSVYKQL